MNSNSPQWIDHICEGQRVAKCATCGMNSYASKIGTNDECRFCREDEDDARLAAAKRAATDALLAASAKQAGTLNIDGWVRIR